MGAAMNLCNTIQACTGQPVPQGGGKEDGGVRAAGEGDLELGRSGKRGRHDRGMSREGRNRRVHFSWFLSPVLLSLSDTDSSVLHQLLSQHRIEKPHCWATFLTWEKVAKVHLLPSR